MTPKSSKNSRRHGNRAQNGAQKNHAFLFLNVPDNARSGRKVARRFPFQFLNFLRERKNGAPEIFDSLSVVAVGKARIIGETLDSL